MAWSLPRLLRQAASRSRPHAVRDPAAMHRVPAVVTIHDLSFEDDALMGRRDRLVFRRVVPRAARRAARVLTVSERTKRDLVAALRPGARARRRDAERRRSRVRAGRASARRRRRRTSSPSGRSRSGRTSARRSPPPGRSGSSSSSSGRRRTSALRTSCVAGGARLEGYVTIERLAALYRGAACLVQASRHEGFGLPVVEAMASGTPVVVGARPGARRGCGRGARSSWPEDGARRRDPPCVGGARATRRRRARACARIHLGGGRADDRPRSTSRRSAA